MFRVVVQDTRQTPTSGKVVAQLGSYDPHTKAVTLDKEQATTYLSNGAQPSDRVALLLKKEGIKLPDWVVLPAAKQSKLKNAEKLRKNQPKEEKTEEKTEEPEAPVAEEVAENPAEETTEAEVSEATKEEAAPAEESSEETKE